MGVADRDPLAQLSLPPGFRFYPTDEELLVQYLCRKVAGHHFSLPIIAEIDLYKFDPWDLPGKATFGEKEWYFFSPRDRKYPNGSRPNRVAGSGYWKATGTDKMITTQGRKVGIKKSLVFYIGKAPKGTKTNWIMHEFRLTNSPCKGGSLKLDDWVLCRIYKKMSSAEKSATSAASRENGAGGSPSSSSSQLDDVLDSLPEIDDSVFALPRMNSLRTNNHQQEGDTKLGLVNSGSGSFDWGVLAGLTTGPELVGIGQNQAQFQQLGGHVMNDGGDMCVPSSPPLCHVESPGAHLGGRVEEGVQSGIRRKRANVSGGDYLGRSPNSMWAQSYTNLIDPFGIQYPYPSPRAGFGFGG